MIKNEYGMTQLEIDAWLEASGSYLSGDLPNNFFELSEEEQDELIIENIWQPFEGWPPKDVMSEIHDRAKLVYETYQLKGLVTELGNYYI